MLMKNKKKIIRKGENNRSYTVKVEGGSIDEFDE
jgi:hypothetical protein